MSAISPQDQLKIEALRAVGDRIHHIHALVERFATARGAREAEAYSLPLKRELGRFKRDLTANGFGIIAQKAGELQTVAGRHGPQGQKTRRLREGVGALRSLTDLEKRRVVTAAKRSAAPTPDETEPAVD